MRNPSGGAPNVYGDLLSVLRVSIDEKPVRRCAMAAAPDLLESLVSIDEKPVRRCASHVAKSLKSK